MDIFPDNIFSHAFDQYHINESCISDLCNMRISMTSVSGYEKVAMKAIMDVRRKDCLRITCETDAEFKYKWRMECHKKEEKKRAIKDGTWRTQLYRVSFNREEPESNKAICMKRGRFLVTIYPRHDTNVPVSVCKKGRFLVSKYYVHKKPEVNKPTVTKKGRFLITTTY